jgi:hypothetical protein
MQIPAGSKYMQIPLAVNICRFQSTVQTWPLPKEVMSVSNTTVYCLLYNTCIPEMKLLSSYIA